MKKIGKTFFGEADASAAKILSSTKKVSEARLNLRILQLDLGEQVDQAKKSLLPVLAPRFASAVMNDVRIACVAAFSDDGGWAEPGSSALMREWMLPEHRRLRRACLAVLITPNAVRDAALELLEKQGRIECRDAGEAWPNQDGCGYPVYRVKAKKARARR